jgi:RNA polymerase sigma-70 factor, ECF subfamily
VGLTGPGLEQMKEAPLGTDAQRPAEQDTGSWLEQHGDYLYKYAVFRLRDQVAAEDAVQETFLAALKAYGNFEGRGSERTWLVGILKHKITDHFRRLTRDTPLGSGGDDDPAEDENCFRSSGEWTGHWEVNGAPTEWHASPAELVEQHDFWKVFNDCLALLPQRTASAFALREADGLSSEEICTSLGIKANNLWVMLHRARMHLRGCLEANWFRKQPSNE